jgi:molybdate/tungstate transport system substrate-binding protein
LGLAGIALVLAALAGACGSSSSASSSRPSGSHGSLNVLYAGSLETLMNQRLGPAFEHATGYSFNGYPAGSKDLASEIKGKVRQGDVFISASPKVDATLQGTSNGDWVSWFTPFATTTLELGYNPSSSYATALRHGPWYRALSRLGFRLGFTDPKLDPKGVLAVAALNRAAALYRDPALRNLATNPGNLFPEEDLVGRLQAGQLDGGFFYTVEATAAHIAAVPITPVHERATYTITVLRRALHAPAAVAFVKFILGRRGQALLRRAGLTVAGHLKASGNGVPPGLDGVVQPTQ